MSHLTDLAAAILVILGIVLIIIILFWGIRYQITTARNYKEEKPECWYGGFFYYNKNDKRFFVPKSYGVTINFGHPVGLTILAIELIFLGAYAIYYFFKH